MSEKRTASTRGLIGGRGGRRPLRLLGGFLAGLTCVAALAGPAAAAQAGNGQAAGPQGASSQPPAAEGAGPMASAEEFRTVAAAMTAGGTVDVLVGLRTPFSPEGDLAPARVRAQRDGIARERERLLEALRGTRFEVVNTFKTVPSVALRLSGPALEALRASGQAGSLALDEGSDLHLAGTTELVESVQATQAGRTGAGQYIAILDTGVDSSHPFLDGKVKEEACYSSSKSCPNGEAEEIATGAAASCVGFDRCDHGTHVAGIAAGKGPAFSGVAPEASLIAVSLTNKVCADGEPCKARISGHSYVIKALEYVFDLRQVKGLPVAAVNMSFGGGSKGTCDKSELKPAIENLRSVGVASVASTGNHYSNTGITEPACVSTVVAVGGGEGPDAAHLSVAPSSNSSESVDLLAPNYATSSVPGDGFKSMMGTSQAAPHVAGAFAVLRQLAPSAPVGEIEGVLKATGIPLTDEDNGVKKPFLQLWDASLHYKAHLSVNDVTVLEGDTGTKDAMFTIVRAGTPTTKVTADFSTLNGSAVAPGDYQQVAGSVTLWPWQMAIGVPVKITGDHIDESNEKFGLQLSNLTGASTSAADGLGVGTITDDEKPISDTQWEIGEVTIDDINVIEGHDRTTKATFTLTLAKPISNFASVDVHTPEFLLDNYKPWAQPGTDYVPRSETITFLPGETSKTFTVAILGDKVLEANEQIAASLSNPSHLTVMRDSGIAWIVNDDFLVVDKG